MSTGDDDSSSGLNGRLRPRKSTPSFHNKTTRKSEGKGGHERPKRTNTPSKVLPNKPDDLANKSEPSSAPNLLCPYCDRKFASKQNVSKHARRIHLSSGKQEGLIGCLFCSHTEPDADIIRHMVDSHPNQYFACLECHSRFSSTSELAEHKLQICEKQKPAYRNNLRQKSSGSKKSQKRLSVRKDEFQNESEEYANDHEFNGMVISCELKPTQVFDEADIEDNITTNLILPPSKTIGNTGIEKSAVIVLDDLQWKKRIPTNFSFHNSDADQILSRLGVVHRAPRSESARKDLRPIDDSAHKFEKCFDTSFYSKVASNVQENLTKFLDGSFNFNPDPDSTIKTRKSKNSVVINTAEGFPILLAFDQFSRNASEGYMPRALAARSKWKWEVAGPDRNLLDPARIERDSHVNNCIISLVSSLDIWTQLCMRRKFEEKFKNPPLQKKTERLNIIIGKELKEILESREIPSSSQLVKYAQVTETAPGDTPVLPEYLGLRRAQPALAPPPAVLSGEWVRPRCYVCCACGTQSRDSRSLAAHAAQHHPNAQVQHYEIVGESLLNADICKHLYVPPSQVHNRTRPLRGIRDCTKCKKTVSLEDLHQHMLDCAGDTPAVRRKCRYRPFGVRRRRPRLPDNTIRRKIRKDLRHRQRQRQKVHRRARPRIRSEVGDAETIRKMIADLPAKRHRVLVNPGNSLLRPRRNLEKLRNKLKINQHTSDHNEQINFKSAHGKKNDVEVDDAGDDDEDQPLKPRVRRAPPKPSRKIEPIQRKTMSRVKRKQESTDYDPPISSRQRSRKPYTSTTGKPNNRTDQMSNAEQSERVDPSGSRDSNRHGEGGAGGRGRARGDEPHGTGGDGAAAPRGDRDEGPGPPPHAPLKHSIAQITGSGDQDREDRYRSLATYQEFRTNQPQPLHFDSYATEVVATKHDGAPADPNCKPPAEPGGISKANMNKQIKVKKVSLNDCIAKLKHKLVPEPGAPPDVDDHADGSLVNLSTSSVVGQPQPSQLMVSTEDSSCSGPEMKSAASSAISTQPEISSYLTTQMENTTKETTDGFGIMLKTSSPAAPKMASVATAVELIPIDIPPDVDSQPAQIFSHSMAMSMLETSPELSRSSRRSSTSTLRSSTEERCMLPPTEGYYPKPCDQTHAHSKSKIDEMPAKRKSPRLSRSTSRAEFEIPQISITPNPMDVPTWGVVNSESDARALWPNSAIRTSPLGKPPELYAQHPSVFFQGPDRFSINSELMNQHYYEQPNKGKGSRTQRARRNSYSMGAQNPGLSNSLQTSPSFVSRGALPAMGPYSESDTSTASAHDAFVRGISPQEVNKFHSLSPLAAAGNVQARRNSHKIQTTSLEIEINKEPVVDLNYLLKMSPNVVEVHSSLVSSMSGYTRFEGMRGPELAPGSLLQMSPQGALQTSPPAPSRSRRNSRTKHHEGMKFSTINKQPKRQSPQTSRTKSQPNAEVGLTKKQYEKMPYMFNRPPANFIPTSMDGLNTYVPSSMLMHNDLHARILQAENELFIRSIEASAQRSPQKAGNGCSAKSPNLGRTHLDIHLRGPISVEMDKNIQQKVTDQRSVHAPDQSQKDTRIRNLLSPGDSGHINKSPLFPEGTVLISTPQTYLEQGSPSEIRSKNKEDVSGTSHQVNNEELKANFEIRAINKETSVSTTDNIVQASSKNVHDYTVSDASRDYDQQTLEYLSRSRDSYSSNTTSDDGRVLQSHTKNTPNESPNPKIQNKSYWHTDKLSTETSDYMRDNSSYRRSPVASDLTYLESINAYTRHNSSLNTINESFSENNYRNAQVAPSSRANCENTADAYSDVKDHSPRGHRQAGTSSARTVDMLLNVQNTGIACSSEIPLSRFSADISVGKPRANLGMVQATELPIGLAARVTKDLAFEDIPRAHARPDGHCSDLSRLELYMSEITSPLDLSGKNINNKKTYNNYDKLHLSHSKDNKDSIMADVVDLRVNSSEQLTPVFNTRTSLPDNDKQDASNSSKSALENCAPTDLSIRGKTGVDQSLCILKSVPYQVQHLPIRTNLHVDSSDIEEHSKISQSKESPTDLSSKRIHSIDPHPAIESKENIIVSIDLTEKDDQNPDKPPKNILPKSEKRDQENKNGEIPPEMLQPHNEDNHSGGGSIGYSTASERGREATEEAMGSSDSRYHLTPIESPKSPRALETISQPANPLTDEMSYIAEKGSNIAVSDVPHIKIHNNPDLRMSANRIESTKPVYTLANSCITMTGVDSTKSNILTNKILNESEVNSDSSIIQRPGVTITSLECSKANILPNNYTCASNVDNTDQDTDTAKKIAMLPKELAEILGSMPQDHRNQLLNVLPQYVVTETISITSKAKSINSNAKDKNSTNTTSVMPSIPIMTTLLAPACTQTTTETIPSESVVLKCTSVPDFEENCSYLILPPPPPPLPPISPLHAQPLDCNETKPDVANASKAELPSQEISIKALSAKSSNERTASLRAVRIKATSARNKQTSMDGQVSSKPVDNEHTVPNVSITPNSTVTNLLDLDKSLAIQQAEVSSTQQNNKDVTKVTIDSTSLVPPILDNQKSLENIVNIVTPQIENNIINAESVVEPIVSKAAHVSSSVINYDNESKSPKVNQLENNLESEKCELIASDMRSNGINVLENEQNTTPKNQNAVSVLTETLNRPISAINTANTPIEISDSSAVSETPPGPSTASVDLTPVSTDPAATLVHPNVVPGDPIETDPNVNDIKTSDPDSEDDISLAVIVMQKNRELEKNDTQVVIKNINADDKTNNLENTTNPGNQPDNSNTAHNSKTDTNSIHPHDDTIDNLPIIREITENKISLMDEGDAQQDSMDDETPLKVYCTDKSKERTKIQQSAKKRTKSKERKRKQKDQRTTKHQEKGENNLNVTNCIETNNVNINNTGMIQENMSVESKNDSVENTSNKDIQNGQTTDKPSQSKKTKKRNMQKSKQAVEVVDPECHKNTLSNTELEIINKEHVIASEENLSRECHQDNSAVDDETIIEKSIKGKEISEESNCKNSKLVRIQTPINTSIDEPTPASDFQLCSNIEETVSTPLRRSKRGKSMFIESSISTNPVPNTAMTETENTLEQRTPLTKKQLIFSKLLLDEENQNTPESNPVIESDNSHIATIITAEPLLDTLKNQVTIPELQTDTTTTKQNKRKLNHDRGNRRKKKFNENSYEDTQPITEKTDIGSNLASLEVEVLENVQTNNELAPKSDLTASCKIGIEKSNAIVSEISIPSPKTISPTDKRKITTPIEVQDTNQSLPKKGKLNESVPVEAVDESIKNDKIVEIRKIQQPERTACYNKPVATKRSRSKSVVVKSAMGSYDPYDIDFDDMIEKETAAKRKTIKDKYASRNKSRPNSKQARVKNGNKKSVTPINLDSSTIEENIQEDFVPSVFNFSDSDDSSKSDIPLQRYVIEKAKRNELKSKSILPTTPTKIRVDCEDTLNEVQIEYPTLETTFTDNKLNQSKTATEGDADSNTNKTTNAAEHFLQTFGFFAERIPRKCNLLASKKISETFNSIGNDSDDTSHEIIRTRSRKPEKTNDNKPSDMRAEVAASPFDEGSALSQLAAAAAAAPACVPFTPAPSVAAAAAPSPVPEAPAIVAPELAISTSAPAIAAQAPAIVGLGPVMVGPASAVTAPVSANTDAPINEDDLDFLTAQSILESEEVRNLERELISGFEEAACASFLSTLHTMPLRVMDTFTPYVEQTPAPTAPLVPATLSALPTFPSPTTDSSTLPVVPLSPVSHAFSPPPAPLSPSATSSPAAPPSPTAPLSPPTLLSPPASSSPIAPSTPSSMLQTKPAEIVEEPKKSKLKAKKPPGPKDQMYPELDNIDLFEDKFDKIKRKSRTQAAAAKQPPVVEAASSNNGRKKIERKRPNAKKQNTQVLTKGALKGFEGIKVSIPTSDINMTAIVSPTRRRKKKNASKKRRSKKTSESSEKTDSEKKDTKKTDVYEFMDNDDTEPFEFRASTLMERLKSIGGKERAHSESDDDGDDFVYMSDDYVGSDSDASRGSDPARAHRRRDAAEKNAVMGKIFRNNAFRADKKPKEEPPRPKEPEKPKADLDSLFDSLLEVEPNSSALDVENSPPPEPARPPCSPLPASPHATPLQLNSSPARRSPSPPAPPSPPALPSSPPSVDAFYRKPRKSYYIDSEPSTSKAFYGGPSRYETSQGPRIGPKRYVTPVSVTPRTPSPESRGPSPVPELQPEVGEAGVAQHRARRKCTVGKQNVLAETWSSESESEVRAGGASSAEGVSAARRRRRARAPRAPRPPPPAARARSPFHWSSGDEEAEQVQQHGWIVGDSHKKLVTMLAHAKGRKRTDDGLDD